jgi:hypothetical protein
MHLRRLLVALATAATLGASDYNNPSPVPPAWDYTVSYPDRSGVVTSTTYEVGPGKTYANPRDVPWLDLQPGDQVLISYRAQPYTDAILLCARGEPTRWITVKGVPGPNGERPIFDGNNARMPGFGLNMWFDGGGMIKIHRPIGLSHDSYRPGYLHISGLEVRHVKPPAQYTDYAGATAAWGSFSAGISGQGFDYVAITDCDLHDNGLGLFVNSTNGAYFQSSRLLVSSNYFHNNSNVGSFSEHNAYTEGIGTVYEYNYFGPIIDGSFGDNIKERSAGIVFRYNYIEGGADLIALRDPESNVDHESAQLDAWGTKLVAGAYIYANTLVTRNYVQAIIGHGDGGMGTGLQPREGHLNFYGNRVISTVDNEGFWNSSQYFAIQGVPLFDLLNTRSPTTVVARNNVLYGTRRTVGGTAAPLGLFYWQGLADFQQNWINDYIEVTSPFGGGNLAPGVKFDGSGLGGLVEQAGSPGFVDFANGDYHLTTGSPGRSLAAALPASVTLRGLVPVADPVQTPFEHVYGGPNGGNAAPMVSAATATPATVTASTTALVATASDDAGEAALIYSWSASPATVTFSASGTHAARSTIATFVAAGTYTMTVTVRDAGNLTATRSVTVTVRQTPATVTVSPAAVSVATGANATLGVVVLDQFAAAIAGPSITWTVVDGGGSVTPGGVYTAPATAGSSTVRATCGAATGSAALTISAGGGVGSGGSGGTAGSGSSGGCGGGVAGILFLGLACAGLRRSRRRS